MPKLARIRAIMELRSMAEPGGCDGDPETLRERIQAIIEALCCCPQDTDGDGNCPRHPERRRF